ncbi:MAG: DciA family protein [Aquisalimonadaceae bacterium]
MDRPRRPRSIAGTLRESGSTLAALRREVEQLRKQEAVLERVLPDALQGHCRLARVRPDALVLTTDSPGWGNQLRFLGPTLCDALAETVGFRPKRLQIRVVSPPKRPAKATPRILSEQAGRHLESAARAQTDPKLRDALLRLSKRR